MIAIIDYGVGNLFSLQSSFKKIGADVIVTSDKDEIKKADKIILPGVGAFSDAMKKLKETGLDVVVKEEVKNKKPLLGICLGMQLLFTKSFEYGEYDGLNLIEGEIRPIADVIDRSLKIPHMGWNSLNFKIKDHPLFKYVNENDYVYFVHSYYATNCEKDTIATSNYSYDLTASVGKDNVMGCQFHPEKSGEVGLKILKAFCEM